MEHYGVPAAGKALAALPPEDHWFAAQTAATRPAGAGMT